MTTQNQSRTSRGSEKLAFAKEFKKQIIWAVSGIVAVLGFFVWKDIKSRPDDPTQEANKITSNKDLHRWALDLAVKLGTNYGWYDPRSWTENDQGAYDIVSKISPANMHTVSKLYFEVYAKGRDLKTDLAKLLDSKLYNKLTNI